MSDVVGFVKANGKKLVNGKGQEFLLRGVGLGGWLLPEGYMWCLPQNTDRPRRIEKMIFDLVGKDKSERFWELYFERYTSEADIKKIAEEGFNSVRVPINSRHLITSGEQNFFNEKYIKLIDNVIDWCKIHNLYVILDLHGAPGGQTGANIDDSENDKPELFMEGKNRQLTVELWRRLAERYRDEGIVAGYDLLNEPLPEWFSDYNNQLMPLYLEIIKAIRQVDKNHMIILEGTHWATDWSIFDKKPDDNIMLQFHKYWNNPDTESIQAFLDKREELNVPIFMGEGGENNKEWFTGAFGMYEDHEISWNFWTWKKMNKSNSPCSIKLPEGWANLISFLEKGTELSEAEAGAIFDEFLENIKFENCQYHSEIANALFRRPPVLIPAVFYDYKGSGISFSTQGSSNNQTEFRAKDGVDIRFVDGVSKQPNFKHTGGKEWAYGDWMYISLFSNDWVCYQVNVEENVNLFFNINLCVNSPREEGRLCVSVDDEQLETLELWQEKWVVEQIGKKLNLRPGKHQIMLKAVKNSVSIKWIEIVPCAELR